MCIHLSIASIYGPIGFGTARVSNHYHWRVIINKLNDYQTRVELVLQEGMTFVFEPNCGFGHHLCNLGGTVVVGKSKGLS